MLDLLIDLDNTMYSETDAVFAQVDAKMKKFISSKFNISLNEAHKIQKKYFLENGTTLRGLMLNHNMDPEPFLSYVHDIDLTAIKKNPKLRTLLESYDGKKIIFTNATLTHAENVLQKIDVLNSIDSIFDIKDAEYLPKPHKKTYERVIEKYGLIPSNTVMIDDIPINLVTASKLGLKTILIDYKNEKKISYVDHINYDISNIINKLLNKEIF